MIFAVGFLFISFCLTGQDSERNVTYKASIGTGIDMNEPSYTPFIFHVLAHYRVGNRFSAGIGTGFSLYEATLIPLFVNAKLAVTQPRKFTPFVECGSGYAFAANTNANGGFHLNSSLGVQYALSEKMKLQLSAGYELQKLERLKNSENDYFTSFFAEKLTHHLLSVKVGIVF